MFKHAHISYNGIYSFLLKRKKRGSFVSRRPHCLNVCVGVPCVLNHINTELILVLEWSRGYISQTGKYTLLRARPSIASSHCFLVRQLACMCQAQSKCFQRGV